MMGKVEMGTRMTAAGWLADNKGQVLGPMDGWVNSASRARKLDL